MPNELTRSVLILDDDAIFRGMVHDLVKVRGITVVEARSVKEADTKMGGFSPALAIVDYRLGEGDGVSYITKMRDEGRNFPIIFVSGTWCDEKTFNWLRNILRVSLILRKPIEPSIFLQQIESLLPGHVLAQAEQNMMDAVPMIVNSVDVLEAHAIGTSDQTLIAEVKAVRDKLGRQQQYNQARVKYGKELEESWYQLVAAVELSHEDVKDKITIHEAISLAHRIRGTAGTLGFDRIGIAAGKIEDMMRAIDPEDIMLGVLWSEIDRAVEAGNESLAQQLSVMESQDSISDDVVYTKILIVGGEEDYKPVTRNLQTRSPVEFDIAEGIASIANRLKQFSFDGAIIDCSVESSTSRICSIVSEIRSIPGQQTLPIALVCTQEEPPEAGQLLYAGSSCTLFHKPDRNDIEDVVNKLLTLRQNDKPKILTVDDDQILTGFIANVLSSQQMSVRALNKPILIMEAMKEFNPDLVLLDVIMPGLSGYDVCRMLRSTDEYAKLPILFLTSRNDAEGRAAAFQAGGDDFLSKPVLADELVARVKSQLSQSKSKTVKQAHNLMLNGADLIAGCQSFIDSNPDAHLTFCLISIDDFINLSVVHGFLSAQEVTNRMAALIQNRFRNEDMRSRISEDGFAIGFPDIAKATATDAIRQLLNEFGELKFTSGNLGNFKVTFSAGLADTTDGALVQTLLSDANKRLSNSRRDRFGAITCV